MAVSVTSKGQVTIPKRVRDALGITPGSKVEFDVAGGGARLKLVKRHASSRIEEGAAILNYKGPRIPVDQMHGGLAMSCILPRVARAASCLRSMIGVTRVGQRSFASNQRCPYQRDNADWAASSWRQWCAAPVLYSQPATSNGVVSGSRYRGVTDFK